METICANPDHMERWIEGEDIMKNESKAMSIIQVYIFKDEECLGLDCFYKDTVSIGSGGNADIQLEHPYIDKIHAFIQLKEGRLEVSPKTSSHSIGLNGKATGRCILKSFDFITIGPYTIKVKIPRAMESPPEQIPQAVESEKPLAAWVKPSDNGKQDIESFSIVSEITSEASSTALSFTPTLKRAFNDEDEEGDDQEEKEDEYPRPFLIDALFQSEAGRASASEQPVTLEIIKIKENHIFDVHFLSPFEKYYIAHQNGKFCLAEYHRTKGFVIYFDDRIKGQIRKNENETLDLEEYRNAGKVQRKSKGLFQKGLSGEEQAYLEDGDYRYLIRITNRPESPEAEDPIKEKNPLYKNLFRSAAFHLIALFIMGLTASLPDKIKPEATGMHFVKIDAAELKKPVKAPEPKPTKIQKQSKIPTLRPTEKVLADKPAATSKTLASKMPSKTGSSKTLASANKKTLSFDAGGGSGKEGNVTNRNINQTGILGMIGESIGFTPKEALATVTNLDVVSSPGAGNSNMKVGGIAGKLSTGGISIPAGGVVRSKGSGQVLRSYGASGKGSGVADGKGTEVAALKKGKTGQKDVMGMVSVDLNNTSRVQGGGMTREAVKQVIDQHLDEISFCYENALMDSPTIMGNIVFEWKILKSGRVGEVQIKSSTVRSDQIHACIKSAIKNWQFPLPSNAEVIVSYPFVFNIVGF